MGVTMAVIAAAGTTATTIEQRKARKAQQKALDNSERMARESQAEQESLALQEKKTASSKLRDQQQRLLRASTGRGGLLFGSETGVQTPTTSTLGV